MKTSDERLYVIEKSITCMFNMYKDEQAQFDKL